MTKLENVFDDVVMNLRRLSIRPIFSYRLSFFEELSGESWPVLDCKFNPMSPIKRSTERGEILRRGGRRMRT